MTIDVTMGTHCQFFVALLLSIKDLQCNGAHLLCETSIFAQRCGGKIAFEQRSLPGVSAVQSVTHHNPRLTE